MKKRLIACLLVLVLLVSCGALSLAMGENQEGEFAPASPGIGTQTETEPEEETQDKAIPKKITISGSHYVGKGKTIQLSAAVSPAGASQKVTWKSSNAKIAKVSSAGKVTGVKIGKVTITATSKADKSIKKKWTIYVKKPATKVTVSASISSNTIELSSNAADNTVQLTAKVTPADAYDGVTWKSSDKKIATVNENGKVTGKKAGTVTITATAMDGSGKKGTIKITVQEEKKKDDPVYRALLIGEKSFLRRNNYYQFYTDYVNRNVGDVNNMANMLDSIKTPSGTKYSVTKKYDLSYAGIRSAIKSTFAKTTDNDVSLFFIASHGNQSGDGDLEMSFTGDPQSQADLEDFIYGNPVLPFSTLASWLKQYVKGKVIVIIESCGAGSAVYDTDEEQNGKVIVNYRELNGKEGDAAAARIAKRAVQAFQSADPGIIESNSTGDLRLSKFYVLAAARHHELSWGWEGGSVSGSYNFFTKWLIDGVGRIGKSPADTSNDGFVNLTELFNYISSVGDNYPFETQEGTFYQHVQRYPVGSTYKLFMVK